jgi:hypothetical protein
MAPRDADNKDKLSNDEHTTTGNPFTRPQNRPRYTQPISRHRSHVIALRCISTALSSVCSGSSNPRLGCLFYCFGKLLVLCAIAVARARVSLVAAELPERPNGTEVDKKKERVEYTSALLRCLIR